MGDPPLTSNGDATVIHRNHTGLSPPQQQTDKMPPRHLLPPPPSLPSTPPVGQRPKVIRRASFDMALEMGQRRSMFYANRQR